VRPLIRANVAVAVNGGADDDAYEGDEN